MTELHLTTPDDWHLHLRDGALLDGRCRLRPAPSPAPSSCPTWCRRCWMPGWRYRQRIEAARPAGGDFTP